MSRWLLSRRTLLRGAGASLALPFLDAMRPAVAREPVRTPPLRWVTMYVPNGIHMADWTPAADGPDYDLPRILSPLAPHRSELLVLSGLGNPAAVGDTDGDHNRGTGSFLTAVKCRKTQGRRIRNGISADQVVANHLRAATLLPSLELGTARAHGPMVCEFGWNCVYQEHIAWAGPTTPLPKEVEPRALFDRLFGGFDGAQSPEDVLRRRRLRLSVLDAVSHQAKRLQQRLGSSDRARLDEYLTSVRELERRLTAVPSLAVATPGAPPAQDPVLPERLRALMDLTVLALQADLTRVVTLMLGYGIIDTIYDFLGIRTGHHTLSHHRGDASRFPDLVKIATWEVAQFAYLLQRLREVREGDGTLLDHSIVYLSSEVSDGDKHDHFDLPVVVAGRGNGALSPGRHVRYDGKPPVADLYIAILNAFGLPVTRFGEHGSRPLAGLSA